ncbi:unnamed protein product [Effrenium voratum]|uniref:Uncharacterized protein n=1 Tax=Effrenium voratum TaxID=2562239 RepID=A0AA36NFA1_9DINO|nr:unnamed protein product [Effrenium voratum]
MVVSLQEIATAQQGGGYTQLFFVHEEVAAHALVVQSVSTGFILCLPADAAPLEALQAAEGAGFPDLWGPYLEAVVAFAGQRGGAGRRQLNVVLIDMDASGQDLLFTELPSNVTDDAVVTFGTVRGHVVWPHGPSALQIARSFINAGGDRLEVYLTADERPAEDAQQDSVLAQLLQQQQSIQDMLAGMQSKVSAVSGLERRLAALEQKPATATPPAALPAAAPQMFAEAERVGLPSRAAERLMGLVGPAPRCKGDLGGTAAQRPLVSVDRAGAATAEDGSEADEEPVGEVPKVAATPDRVLAQLLQAQTKILQQLSVREFKERDPLTLLSGGSADDCDASGTKIAGVRGMAARQVLVNQFDRHPDQVVHAIRRRLAAARRHPEVVQPAAEQMYAHFKETVPLGNYKTLTYFSFLLCKAWEHAERGEGAALQATIGLGLCFAEQVAHEQGHTRLGWLLTGIPDPPFSQTEGRRAPRADLPHGQLSDPKWIATNLAFLRDCDSIAERTYRTHEAFRSTEPPAKSGGKGKQKKRQQAEAQGDGSQ